MAATSSWSCENVARWLKSVGFEQYIDFFYTNQIDGRTLLSLTKEDLFLLAKIFDDIFTLAGVLNIERRLNQLRQAPKQPFEFPSGQSLDAGSIEPEFVSQEPNWKEGGFEENVRAMESVFPDYCWRYKSVDVLFKDYVPMVKGESSTANAFPALATHVISPVDFYVQPNLVQPMVKKMQEHLQDVYSESTAAVPRDNVFVGMPCITRYKEDDNWYRAVVVDVVGSDEAPVKFVDYGNRQYSNFEDLKPLKKDFGRLPPAALQCRIQGVRERTLEQKVLDAFHSDINDLGGEVLISIVSPASEPFLVNVFNKYTNENIGLKYLPKEPICPKLPPLDALKKKKTGTEAESGAAGTANGDTEPKVFASDLDAIMEGDINEYSSSDDGQTGEIKRTNKKIRKIQHEQKLQAQRKHPPKCAEEEERFRIVKVPNTDLTFQRRFRKQRKPLIGVVDVRIAHVETTNEVYVNILYYEEATGNVQEALVEAYDGARKQAPALPSGYVVVDNVCVVYEPTDDKWYRCRIMEVSDKGVVLHAADIGRRLPIVPPAEYDRVRMLLCGSCLEAAPQAFYCRIDQLCENQPTSTETRILKELLQVGAIMKAEFERSREPYRLRLWYPETNESFLDRFEKVLNERGLRDIIECERRPCTTVAVWQEPQKLVGSLEKPKEDVKQATVAANGCEVINKPVPRVPTQGFGATGGFGTMQTHGNVNDIEAVLCGSVGAAGYDTDEEADRPAEWAAKCAGKRGGGRAAIYDEGEKDERGSICEFSDEKKRLVAKWLENSVGIPGGSSGPPAQSAPKRPSVAASYNPDLTRHPIGQRSVRQMPAAKDTSGATTSKSVHGDHPAAETKRETRTRLPIETPEFFRSTAGNCP